MAERDGGALPPRPAIAVPPRYSMEGEGGDGGAGVADVSPGTMTLVSSFFADDPDSENRSFSQLLAGAIDSPVVAPPSTPAERGSGGGGEGRGSRQRQRQNWPMFRSPLVAVPPRLCQSSFESPAGLFLSKTGYFGIRHQQALAQVTDGSHSDHKPQHTSLNVDKPADDGYNWRKYGQKQVKGGEYPRSYYKCTYPNCPVKKRVEQSLDGQVTHIIYKGQHNHPLPPQDRHGKECVSGCDEFPGSFHFPANSRTGTANFSRGRDCSHGTSERLSDASEGEVGDGEPGTDEGGDSTQDLKRRMMESTSHRMVTEPRIIVQTTSEVDLLDDGYRWRKYGQKVVKGNPHPRSYYRCTNVGCIVRKHIERSSTDPKAVITTYEGKHNHDVPAARNSSHATTNAGASTSSMHPKAHNTTSNSQRFLRRIEFRNNVQRPIALHPLRKEHNIA
ncbi:probable WRKY transcription factor 4 isoform X2 [Elaeis guineensis]|uniref:Probable WRKY transcription factor 4 isoform X2 n=1 Tax=Elaeis guineensis var. tenera TaxID=51953 RepID=A0A6J0PJJ4_ELAGV|nr:probable WRKY transcription factor 4 isoform X2 [Elaeis guineensis]